VYCARPHADPAKKQQQFSHDSKKRLFYIYLQVQPGKTFF
jgi:hypothetical protein